MSRCFPYPPPGYVRNGASGVALIHSIKKEKVKAEIERKDRTREKKERKREEKEKRREKKGEKSDGKGKRVSEKGTNWMVSKEIHCKKKTDNVAEQLDKSDLTEEHGQPNYLGNICYSSDGTQSSIKRKRDALPSNSNRSHGDIIQLRVPVVKNTKSDAPLCKEQTCSKAGIIDSYSRELPRSQIPQLRGQEQGCSTSTRPKFEATEKSNRTQGDIIRIRVPLVKNTDTPHGKQPCTKQELTKSQIAQLQSQEQSCSTPTRPNFEAPKSTHIDDPKLLPSTSGKTESFLSVGNNDTISKSISLKRKSIETGCFPKIHDPKLFPSTSGKTESLPLGSNGTVSKSVPLKRKPIEKEESLYKSLIENWVPIPLHHEPPADCDDDQQWLFERKCQDNNVEKRLKPSNDVLCYNISSLGPKAQYLPEADIYTLPYTIPF